MWKEKYEGLEKEAEQQKSEVERLKASGNEWEGQYEQPMGRMKDLVEHG